MSNINKYLINGKRKLYGKIENDCAKNALLPIMAASIMCDEPVILNNITYYDDIINMIDILEHLGIKVKRDEESLILDSSSINNFDVPLDQACKLRASIFFLGPLVSKLKKARVAYPGGCCIGARPIDIHINGLQRLGVKVLDRHGIITLNGENMKSNTIFLPFPSVGATENLIMASVFLNGVTTLYGVAKEPEIIDLCNFLNKMGACILGAGTDVIHIYGVKKLGGGAYSPIPDRIATGTYIFSALICGGELEINNVVSEHVEPILDLVKNNGCKIDIKSDKILIEGLAKPFGFGKVETMPYPFFPTDLSQPLSALATICKGNTIIVENLFENRFKHIPELIKMGAHVTIKDRTAFIEGVEQLYGASVVASDLRGGAALVLAGLCAEGYTTISNVELIDRGYYKLEEKLSSVGADIRRLT